MMTETVITDGLTTIGTVREGDDGNWNAYDLAERLVCSAPTRRAATDDLLKVVRLAHARAM
jgi:hypothetical protein